MLENDRGSPPRRRLPPERSPGIEPKRADGAASEVPGRDRERIMSRASGFCKGSRRSRAHRRAAPMSLPRMDALLTMIRLLASTARPHRSARRPLMLAKSLRRARALSFIAFAAFAVTSTAASFASDSWPEFRGPSAQGRSDATGLPQRWSETENVRWKVAIHDRGWSTPVVLGNQVWLTTAHPDGKEMFAICVDRETGRIVHDLKLFDIESPSPLGNDLNCYASPSP